MADRRESGRSQVGQGGKQEGVRTEELADRKESGGRSWQTARSQEEEVADRKESGRAGRRWKMRQRRRRRRGGEEEEEKRSRMKLGGGRGERRSGGEGGEEEEREGGETEGEERDKAK